MKVLVTKALQPTDIDYIEAALDSGIDLIYPESYDVDGVLARVGEADVLMGGMLAEPVLAAAGHVRYFQIPWTGVDNVDFATVEKHGVTVCNSHSNGLVVAEHTIGLLMALAKKLPYHDRMLRQGKWNRISKDGNAVSPFSKKLQGASLVLVGFGAIGQGVAQLMRGFDCNVTVVNRSGELAADLRKRHGVSAVHTQANLTTAVQAADAVVVAVPLTGESTGLINASVLEAMPESAFLVNVSRGTVIDEAALYQALASESIGGAALDTWYSYPNAQNPETVPSTKFAFHELDNLVMSPHRAGYVDAGFPHLDDAIENMNRSFKGDTLINVVSGARGY